MLIKVKPNRFPLETLKKLHIRRRAPYKVLRRLGSSAYELDIPHDLEISLVFCVGDLTRYRTSTGPQLLPVRPSQPPLLRPTTEEFVQSFSV